MRNETLPLNAETVDAVRTALIKAGHRLGPAHGDHWPLVNTAVLGVMRDWEALKTERAVHAEMKRQSFALLDAMDQKIKTCTAKEQSDAIPLLRELRSIYEGYFARDLEHEPRVKDTKTPLHVQCAESILDTQEADYE